MVDGFLINLLWQDIYLTIGLVLCTEKSESMAKYLLGEKAKQIFASKYQLHLPTEEQHN